MKVSHTHKIIFSLKLLRLIKEASRLERKEHGKYNIPCDNDLHLSIKNPVTSNISSYEIYVLRGSKNLGRVWMDDDDLFDKEAHSESMKGISITFEDNDIHIDTLGVEGLFMDESAFAYNPDTFDEVLFQASTLYDDVPDVDLLKQYHDEVLNLCEELDVTYCSTNIYYDALSEDDMESLIKGIQNVVADL